MDLRFPDFTAEGNSIKCFLFSSSCIAVSCYLFLYYLRWLVYKVLKFFHLINSSKTALSFPGFTDQENSIANIVFNTAARELPGQSLHFETKFVIGEEKLQDIVNAFEAAENAKVLFQGNFERWKIKRKRSIYRLRGIVRTMQEEQRRSNIATMAETAVSFVSAPFPGPSAAVNAFKAYEEAARIEKLNQRVNEAKEVLNDDRQYFEFMEHWFTSSRKVVNALERVGGSELLADIGKDMEKMYEYIRNTNSASKRENLFKNLICESVKKMCKSEKVTGEFGIDLAPVVITYVFVFCLIKRDNRHLCSCVLTTIRVNAASVSAVKAILNLSGLVSGGVLPAGIRRFGMALDVAGFLLAAYDMYNGSVSEQAVEIDKAADALEKELQTLEELHRRLPSVNF